MADLTLEQAEAILDVVEEHGWNLDGDLEIREDYSGRGMYGEETAAFVGRGSQGPVFMAIGVLVERGKIGEEEAERMLRRADSMGLGWVIY
jgi:hypothetical protein